MLKIRHILHQPLVRHQIALELCTVLFKLLKCGPLLLELDLLVRGCLALDGLNQRLLGTPLELLQLAKKVVHDNLPLAQLASEMYTSTLTKVLDMGKDENAPFSPRLGV